MNQSIQCKACNFELTSSVHTCPNCGIDSPIKISDKKKQVFYIGIALFIVLIIVIPMVASLLWMQSK